MEAIGICLGASNISIVEVTKKDNSIEIKKTLTKSHEGNPKKVLLEELKKLNTDSNIAVTGRKFRQLVSLTSISEPEAVEVALTYLKEKDEKFNNVDVAVSLGGENFMVYVLDNENKISNVVTGNKCASGTGEFFLQQIGRMNLSVEEAVKLARKGKPHSVAGRCSVFCKSDCTHALNKGEPKENVVAGLCKMMANKVLELLDKSRNKQNVVLIGGASQNKVMVDFLKKEIPNLHIPEEAPYFEALGSALWAISHKTKPYPGSDNLIKKEFSSFSFLSPLKDFESKVVFKKSKKSVSKAGDICILGLDVGSTTTKAVLMRKDDNAILASIYLRTNGNPVLASRKCYKELLTQIDKKDIKIIGLGVTGSGRQIAGLHALTDSVINEIIAHATAAVYFDKDVDTIFEIGGQDAKYTYITNCIPSDYAMNEACSAGTGSFLEESAKETLKVEMTKIADLALKGKKPPNFNDQCAAFISSDIKNAMHEGFKKEEILAGLVYSICMNYTNRVKGSRPMGNKIFMQGGVCYNQAVPMAMAALTGKNIIVPPEPGLIGAFGVALEVKKRQHAKLLKEANFDLQELTERTLEYGKPFICAGGEEKCDLQCEITTIKISDKTHPFGGACNRYTNIRQNLKYDVKELDLVALRQKLMYEKYAALPSQSSATGNKPPQKTIGINKSLYTETLYPLYYNFFTKLGLQVVIPDTIESEGINRKKAAFCYPVEISHGYMQNLIHKNPDYFFLPHLAGIYVKNGFETSCTCPFVQGETYYLRTAFKELNKKEVIDPIINFDKGYKAAKEQFIEIGKRLGFDKKKSSEAFDFAVERQLSFQEKIKEMGRNALKLLEKDPSKIGIVIFGRPYNAFSKEANMATPHKFASRGILTIPFDFLPYEDEAHFDHMYWSIGQMILKAANFVKKHPQLFATYITNFSCGPDSFIITYFRDIMGKKPSLTLELDSHSADVGINTRVEAALDIIKGYHELEQHKQLPVENGEFIPAKVVSEKGRFYVKTSDGEKLRLTNQRIKILIPSMGDISSRLGAAALRSSGFSTQATKVPDTEILSYGRANSSCKECLPLILTTGSLIQYVEKTRKPGEIIVYFMPNTFGPCRFGQYNIFMQHLIKKNRMKDVAIFVSNIREGYTGFPVIRALKAVIVADILGDIKNTLSVLAENPEKAMETFEKEVKTILSTFEDKKKNPSKQVRNSVKKLNTIPLKYPLSKAKIIALIGEIYVRNETFSCQNLENKLAKKGFILKVAPILEWLQYCNHQFRFNNIDFQPSLTEKIPLYMKSFALNFMEKQVKNLFKGCNLYKPELVDMDSVIEHASHLINPALRGEAIVTVGSGLKEILNHACGVISIGPFGCMPSRIAEAILSEEMTMEGKIRASKTNTKIDGLSHLPFLAIETDGNPFPPIIESKLEAFLLQANRVHEKINR